MHIPYVTCLSRTDQERDNIVMVKVARRPDPTPKLIEDREFAGTALRLAYEQPGNLALQGVEIARLFEYLSQVAFLYWALLK